MIVLHVKRACFIFAVSDLTVCAEINSKSQRSSGQSRACVTACSRPSPRTDAQVSECGIQHTRHVGTKV